MVQKIFSRFMLGAMRLKMTIFIEGNSLCRVAKNFQPFYVGGDATENDDFQRGKQCLQGYKKFSASIQRFSEFRDSLNSEILWIQRFSEFRDSLISEILWLHIFHGKCFQIHKKCCTQICLLFEKQTFDTPCFGSEPSVVTANHKIAKLICNTEPFP